MVKRTAISHTCSSSPSFMCGTSPFRCSTNGVLPHLARLWIVSAPEPLHTAWWTRDPKKAAARCRRRPRLLDTRSSDAGSDREAIDVIRPPQAVPWGAIAGGRRHTSRTLPCIAVRHERYELHQPFDRGSTLWSPAPLATAERNHRSCHRRETQPLSAAPRRRRALLETRRGRAPMAGLPGPAHLPCSTRLARSREPARPGRPCDRWRLPAARLP